MLTWLLIMKNKHGYQIGINYIEKIEEDEICMSDG